jgi:cellulose synthase/poly-beta-1,6-N-acetylglucosamine synthase-like glycosyltransferase
MVFAIIFCAAILGLTLFYVLLISYFIQGWGKGITFRQELTLTQPDIRFSIIIAARNEQDAIQTCLQGIIAQSYPPELFEVIVVDDFSEDDTSEKVQEVQNKYPQYHIRYVRLQSGSGKKKAIEYGISVSDNEWIITTDADCTMQAEWLSSIASFLAGNKNSKLVSAPVRFTYDTTFFRQAQALEFMGLIGIGAACIWQGSPTMCNGANLIYKKSAFYEVNGFKDVDHIASGDDEFLMHKIAEKWPGQVHFLADKRAIVSTPPNTSLKQFIRQRKRWVSKSRLYKNKRITNVLIVSYLYHLAMLIALILGFWNPLWLLLFALAFGSKLLVEYIFLRRVAAFFNERRLVRLLIPSAFLYILYVVFIGIYGNFGKYRWKGRTVS